MRDLPVASHAGRAGLGLGGMSGKGTHSALSPEGKGPGEGCSGTGGSTGEAGGRTDRIMSKDQEGGQCGWRSMGRSGRHREDSLTLDSPLKTNPLQDTGDARGPREKGWVLNLGPEG